MFQPFDRSKFPPAPIIDIRIAFPDEAAGASSMPALVDTGSDFTRIPLDYLLEINALESRMAYVRGLFSDRKPVTLYLVDVHLEIGVLVGVEVIGIDDDEAILGRNILNKLYLYLDGPALQTHLLEQPPRRL